jgi:hypothetical protein
VDDIKIDLREIEWDGMNRIDLAVVKELVEGSYEHVMYFWFP